MQPQIVMKFGGTSVGSAEAVQRVLAHVTREQRRPLVVVSAVGGVTDLLLEAAALACNGEPYEAQLQEINRRHHAIAAPLGVDHGLCCDLEADLSRLLQGISMLGELTPRIKDTLVSLGERVSARLVAAALERQGHRARAYDAWELGLETDDHFGCAAPLERSHAAIRQATEALEPDEIPVVTGFVARSSSGHVTTLGRGGSDYSAAIFGAAAGVEEIQIWTDVAGIMRADPKVVDQPEVVPTMHFEEAAELAFFGAKVLHPRTIEPARRAGIPVRVLGTFQVDPADDRPIATQGTLIDDRAADEPVRGLAIRKGVQSLHIHSLGMLEASGFLCRVFEILARHHISVDVVATSEVSVSMTFDSYGPELAQAIEEISTFAELEQTPDRSILCVVGAGLRKDASLLARIFQILAETRVPVRVISQGASRINITVVTDPPYASQAMKALYETFFARG
jgi:aspartate kinase